MAEWDKFEIDTLGKVTIKKVGGEKLENLDVLTLSKRTYFVNKEYLKKLTEYSTETLENIQIYSLVGTDQGSNEKRGITIDIRETKKLNRLEEFITELNQLKEVDKIKDIFN